MKPELNLPLLFLCFTSLQMHAGLYQSKQPITPISEQPSPMKWLTDDIVRLIIKDIMITGSLKDCQNCFIINKRFNRLANCSERITRMKQVTNKLLLEGHKYRDKRLEYEYFLLKSGRYLPNE